MQSVIADCAESGRRYLKYHARASAEICTEHKAVSKNQEGEVITFGSKTGESYPYGADASEKETDHCNPRSQALKRQA